jgi:AcrR family transcriptional regulator
MGVARSAKGTETRNRILDAARGVLADEGMEGFTTRRVAARAGISHGMCHYHFADKRALVLALVEHARSDWIEPLERIVTSDRRAGERIQAIIDWIAEPTTGEVMRVHSTLYWFALAEDPIRERLAAEYALWREQFVRVFEDLAAEEGFEGFEARAIGETFASAADGLVQQQSLDPTIDTRSLLRALFERVSER